jgi:hypothetical protein
MSILRLNGSSGYTEITAPTSAGNNRLTLPTSNGSAGNILGTDGAGNLSWVNGRMVLATSQASTSGTRKDFTSIPSWVKRITVMFNGVSTNGTSLPQVQIGSGAIDTTGYTSAGTLTSGSSATSSASTGFVIYDNQPVATSALIGNLVINLVSSNTWVASYAIVDPPRGNNKFGGGSKTLSNTLDRVRITTVNGTNTFDAGSINILYEG